MLNAKYILVATGAKPAKLNILGEECVTISDQFLELDYLPERIVFIGGGYISFEFAHIAARAGAKKITILHRSNKPLGQFDPDLVSQLVQSTRELGIDVRLQTEVKGIVRSSSDNGLTVNAHAEEIINIFALAIKLGLNTTDIKDSILSYPTKSSDISYML